MTDLTPFERQLSERLGRELAASVRPFDAAAIAAAAIVRRGAGDRVLNRVALAPLPMAPATRRVALVALTAVLALAMFALLVGIAWSGGSRLAFIRANGDVVIGRGDGSEQMVVHRVAAGPAIFTNLFWAPGGEHLAIVDEELQLVIIDRGGDVKHRAGVEPGFSSIAWSPDGQRLAILDGPWLQQEPWQPGQPERHGVPIDAHPDIIRLDGSLDWAVPLPEDFFYDLGAGHVAWSPDGTSIAITGSVDVQPQQITPSSIWIVDLADRTVGELPGEPVLVPQDPTDGVFFDLMVRLDFLPVWLPDGRLVFSRFNSGIWQADPRTGASSPILETTRVACLPRCSQAFVQLIEPSPDGSRLLFDHPVDGLSILDLETHARKPVRLPTLERGIAPAREFLWTADGASLLVPYAAAFDATPQLLAINLDTGEQQVVADGTRFYDYVP